MSTGNGSAATQTITVAKPALPPARRMAIANIKGGKRPGPVRIVVYGAVDSGKTTFASKAPDPVYAELDPDGTSELDVKRWDPPPRSWADLLDCIRILTSEPHEFKTFVVDTVDWAERLLWESLCVKDGVSSIDDVGGGFGKGYKAALSEWYVFLAALEQLQAKRGMHVILLAHAHIRTFKNPAGEDYDRYQIKMHEQAAALIREWAKGVYFAQHEDFADKDKKTKRVRGVTTGARILRTHHSAAWDAKDRYGLPEFIPNDWSEFEKGRNAGPERLLALFDEIARKAKEVGGEVEAVALAYVAKNKDNLAALSQLNDRLNAKLAEKAEQAPPVAAAPAVTPDAAPAAP